MSSSRLNRTWGPRRVAGAALLLIGGVLLPGLQPGVAAPQAGGPRIVVVLDASLSMIVREGPPDHRTGLPSGDTRFQIARYDLRKTLADLARRQPGAQVRLLAYGPTAPANSGGLWAFPPGPGPAFVPIERWAAVEQWMDRDLLPRAPRGPSLLALALERALKLAPDRIILYTDGVPLSDGAATDGAATAEERIAGARERVLGSLAVWNQRDPATTIDVVGVGARLQGAQLFLRELAAETRGYFVPTH